MAFAKVDVYTNAIPQEILTPAPFAFPSGGGSGSGGVTFQLGASSKAFGAQWAGGNFLYNVPLAGPNIGVVTLGNRTGFLAINLDSLGLNAAPSPDYALSGNIALTWQFAAGVSSVLTLVPQQIGGTWVLLPRPLIQFINTPALNVNSQTSVVSTLVWTNTVAPFDVVPASGVWGNTNFLIAEL